ncbi:GPI anchored serine-threonine rich protein [Coccidioides immitis H538.4]|uniref:GPI anchored serine-threonine rich protein n=1 Tax=Coccidioides immitis H538.4 TaxID=396776 RepID=A0A0J8RXZ8_COCIT|nr:GPI anchored serine-threonine rich protein [Coccidioides immitis H538.4]
MIYPDIVLSDPVAVAFAIRQPDYSQPPKGNAISKPSLDEQVVAGEEYTITWDADSPGPISIQLLRGPSENVKPIAVITASTENTGSFKWTPSITLENDVTHYGLLIVDQSTGQYQWSTQFGIKNDQHEQPAPSVTRTLIEPPPVVTLTTTICDETTAPYPTGTAPGTVSSPAPTAPTSYRATPTPSPSSPPFEGAAGRNAFSFGGAILAVAAVLAF